MDLKVFTEGNLNANCNLTKGENLREPNSSPNEKQAENKLDTLIEDNCFLTPKIYSSIHLVSEEDKIKEYELIYKINNSKPFRVYEVENIVIRKPIEYLYKNSILNIIKQRVSNSIPKGIDIDENNLIEDYMFKLREILNKNCRCRDERFI